MSLAKTITILMILVAFALFFWPDDSERTDKRIEENPVSVSETIAGKVDQLFADIASGKSDEVYDRATSDLRKQVSREDFQSFCDKLNERLGSLSDHEVKQMNIADQTGQPTVNATFIGQFERGDGVIAVLYYQKDDSVWRLQHLNVNAPELYDDPSQFRETMELRVENSDPVKPGDTVTVWDVSARPPRKVLERIPVANIRWRVSSPLEPPKFPASGFVTLLVSREQKETLANTKLVSVRRPQAESPNAQ